MAGSETTTPLPDADDTELLRLGKRHAALLRVYSAAEDLSPEDADDIPFDALSDRLNELEAQIARIPAAHTLPGIRVRLWALWSLFKDEPGTLFAGPKPGEEHPETLLVWGTLQDVERLLARA